MIDVKRRIPEGVATIAQLDIYTYSGGFMGDRVIQGTLQANAPVEFEPNDYVEWGEYSEVFELQYLPTAKKTSSFNFEYPLTFVPYQRFLNECDFLDVVLDGNSEYHTGSSDVQFYGNVEQLRDRIQANLNRLYSGASVWTVTLAETVTQAEVDVYKGISLSDQKVWNALTLCKSEFNLNFRVTGRTIMLGYQPTVPVSAPSFSYGKGNGLYEIQRVSQDDTAIVTRLRAYGGSRNISPDYNAVGTLINEYHPNLMLPGYADNASPYYKKGYIDSSNQSIYGIREGVYRNEDIYPSIAGMSADEIIAAGVPCDAVGFVDEVVQFSEILTEDQNWFNVWIKDPGFNPFDYLTENSPSISMTTGALAGYEFEITGCVLDATVSGAKYKLTCNVNSDDAFFIPNMQTIGTQEDKFALLNITMPALYTLAAEQRLYAKALEQLAKSDRMAVVYAIGVDEIYMARNAGSDIYVMEGCLLQVTDSQLGIDEDLCIQKCDISYGSNPVPTYALTLADEPVASTLDAIGSEIVSIKSETKVVKVKSDVSARRNVQSLNRLKDSVFDPDGYFDGTNIRPNSVETLYLSVGAKSWNFILYADIKTNAVVPGYTPQYNNLILGAGTLKHREIKWGSIEAEENYTWTIGSEEFVVLPDPYASYYLYVKCAMTTGVASWHYDTGQRALDYFSGYYLFSVGVVYPSNDSGTFHARGESISYGKTWINGRFITTGVIRSIDGNCEIDLDNNSLALTDNIIAPTQGLIWNRGGDGLLRVVGGISQNRGGVESVIPVDRGVWGQDILLNEAVYIGDQLQYMGSTYQCIYDVPENAGIYPSNATYYKVIAAKGSDGVSINLKGHKTAVSNLPTSGHAINDAWVVDADGHLYVCVATTGVIATDWTDVGQFKGDKGDTGTPAKFLQVSGQQVFKYLSGQSAPTVTSITLTAKLTGTTGGYQWRYWDDATAGWIVILGATSSTYALAYDATFFTGASIRIGCVSGDISDEMTVVRLYDGASIIALQSNQTQAVAATSAGVVSNVSLAIAGNTITVYEGNTLLPYRGTNGWQIESVDVVPAGAINYSYPEVAGYSETVSYTDMSSSADSVQVTFGLVGLSSAGEEFTVYVTQTITKAKSGAAGVSPVSVEIQNQNTQADANGNAFTAQAVVKLLRDDTYVPYADWSYSVETVSGLTYSITNSSDSLLVNISGFTALNILQGYIDLAISIGTTVFHRRITVSRNNKSALIPKGVWVAGTTYTGNANQRDAVKYPTSTSGDWYMAKMTMGTFTDSVWVPSHWEMMNSFSSVATDTLLAENANLAGFIFRGGVLESQDQTGGVPNLKLNGQTGQIDAQKGTFRGTLQAATIGAEGLKVSGDLESQGVVDLGGGDWRPLRYYSSEIWGRGSFGSRMLLSVVVIGPTARYYTRGLNNPYCVEVTLEFGEYGGNPYYDLPLYGLEGDSAGMPVDLVMFSITNPGTYRYRFTQTLPGKKFTVMNVNDTPSNQVYFYQYGNSISLPGGAVRDCFYVGGFLSPSQYSYIPGYGIMLGSQNDNNW